MASPGLFPQPLWISVRREANSVSVWHGSLECQGHFRGPGSGIRKSGARVTPIRIPDPGSRTTDQAKPLFI